MPDWTEDLLMDSPSSIGLDDAGWAVSINLSFQQGLHAIMGYEHAFDWVL